MRVEAFRFVPAQLYLFWIEFWRKRAIEGKYRNFS